MGYGEWDGASVRNTQVAARRAYAEAGLSDPRTDLSLTEVHDCFSITELVTMEDLGLSNPGRAAFDILRSEEHTSELQSLMRISYAVFCLKQNNKHTNIKQH